MKRPMTLQERIDLLNKLKIRATNLHMPVTASKLVETFDEMIANLQDPEADAKAKRYEEMIKLAREGDASMKAAVSKIRMLRINNYLVARSNALTFFERVTLADDEIPYMVNESRTPIVISYIGQDGRARKTQIMKYQEEQQLALALISSEEVEYPLMDIYRGRVADEVKALVDISQDMDNKIDALAWPYITASTIGTFNTGGTRAGKHFVVGGAINIANLPTTNLVVSSSSGAGTRFNKDCLDAILDYIGAWGDILPGGAMSPVVVYLPSKDAMGWVRSITMTSQPNSLVEQVIDTGFPMHYAGRNWVFVGDPTLDPTAGLAYVRTNKPVGQFFEKPGMDQTVDEVTSESRKQNKGSMYSQKVIGWGLPTTWALNLIVCRYKAANT